MELAFQIAIGIVMAIFILALLPFALYLAVVLICLLIFLGIGAYAINKFPFFTVIMVIAACTVYFFRNKLEKYKEFWTKKPINKDVETKQIDTADTTVDEMSDNQIEDDSSIPDGLSEEQVKDRIEKILDEHKRKSM